MVLLQIRGLELRIGCWVWEIAVAEGGAGALLAPRLSRGRNYTYSSHSLQALVQGLKAVPEQLRSLMEEHDRRSEELAHRFESTQVMIFLRRGIKPDCPQRRPEAHRDLLFAEVYPAGEIPPGR
jgi:hypothetical protein